MIFQKELYTARPSKGSCTPEQTSRIGSLVQDQRAGLEDSGGVFSAEREVLDLEVIRKDLHETVLVQCRHGSLVLANAESNSVGRKTSREQIYRSLIAPKTHFHCKLRCFWVFFLTRALSRRLLEKE